MTSKLPAEPLAATIVLQMSPFWLIFMRLKIGIALSKTPLMQVTSPPATWHRCTLDTPKGVLEEGGAEAVTFKLPAEPLAATNAVLLAALQEVQRAGASQAPIGTRDALADALLVSRPFDLV